ncbi:MAG: protein translocase subunit SecD [Actinomycetes bacterium]
MAAPPTPRPRPWRPIIALFAVIAAMYGGILLLGDHGPATPRLGLDLRGGTSVTLTARSQDGGSVSSSALNQALDIIRARVNGKGVAEAEVVKQGNNNIVVSIPGSVEDTEGIGTTALLRFRPVLQSQPAGPAVQPTPNPSGSPSGSPSAQPNGSVSPSASPSATDGATNSGRVMSDALRQDQSPSSTPTSSASPSGSPTASPSGSPAPGTEQPGGTELTPAVQRAFEQLDCSNQANRTGRGVVEPADQLLLACDQDGTFKYILGPTAVEGTHITSANAGLPASGGVGQWQVNLTFDDTGTRQFADITTTASAAQPPQNQVAIVLDGVVVSAPVPNGPITGGQAEITGSFTQREAQNLADVLRYGALPLAFTQSDVSTISPTLGNDQLVGGLLAGAIGLALVMLFCLVYYRGLGLVAIASLGVAALLTYGAVVLLGEWQGFTLTLAGIAGLIVAIGITADSFVVFFERLRDEVREGRSLRTAVEQGWGRARRTILVADTVSLLAAVFLYYFAVGGVRGFAFTLGLTTIIDVIVVFLFTKPLITVLARTKFYGGGHRWSGLDPVRLGARPPAAAPATIVARRAAGVKEA